MVFSLKIIPYFFRALYKADLPSEISSIECAADAKILRNRALCKADLLSESNSIECALHKVNVPTDSSHIL